MQVIERILHMLRVKDCRRVCLFCEYYDMCKQDTGSRKEVKENEHEICNIAGGEGMRKIIIVAAAVVITLGAGFTYTLYKVGEGMHLHRCGWRQPDDRGFM